MEKVAWIQFALVFCGAVCLFVKGARMKSIPLTRNTWFEIVQGAAIVVLLLALATDGRGLLNWRAAGSDSLIDECVRSGC